MPWNLLILPLVGGYYILTRSYFFKYKQQRLDRQRLVFESILIAVLLAILAYTLRLLALFFIPIDYLQFHEYLPLKLPFLGTSLLSLTISVAFSEIGNAFFDREKNIKRAIKLVGNEFELILKSSFSDSQLIQITLKNEKVYIGWVKELPIPSISNYIRIIPAISGYRNEERKTILNTHYLNVYSEYIQEGRITNIKELNVDLIISNIEIISVSYFDLEMYEKFNKLKSTQTDLKS